MKNWLKALGLTILATSWAGVGGWMWNHHFTFMLALSTVVTFILIVALVKWVIVDK